MGVGFCQMVFCSVLFWFFCICCDDNVVLVFYSVNTVFYISWVLVLNQPCIPGVNPSWSWYYNTFYILLVSVSKYFVGYFWIYIYEKYSSVVFLWCLCLTLVSGEYWPHKISWELFPLPQFSGRVYEELCITSSLKTW